MWSLAQAASRKGRRCGRESCHAMCCSIERTCAAVSANPSSSGVKRCSGASEALLGWGHRWGASVGSNAGPQGLGPCNRRGLAQTDLWRPALFRSNVFRQRLHAKPLRCRETSKVWQVNMTCQGSFDAASRACLKRHVCGKGAEAHLTCQGTGAAAVGSERHGMLVVTPDWVKERWYSREPPKKESDGVWQVWP